MKLDRSNSALKKFSTANFLLLLLSSKLSDEIVIFAKITAIRSGQNRSPETFKFASYKL